MSDQGIERIKNETIGKCLLCGGLAHVPNKEGYLEPCICAKKFELYLAYLRAEIPQKYFELGLDAFEDKMQVGFRQVNDYIQNLDNALKKGIGLYLSGGGGTGKALLACAVLKEALKKGHTGYFSSLWDIMDRIKEGFNNPAMAKELLDILQTCDLLVIDKIRKVQKTDYNMQRLGEILTARDFKSKATIVTDSVGMETLDKFYDNDICGYFVEHAISVVLHGEDYKQNRQKLLIGELKE